MRAAVLLVALAAGGCGGSVTHHPDHDPPGARARAIEPCAATTRARDVRLRVLAGTPDMVVDVPAGLRAGHRVPLVLGLHGAGQDARGFEGESNFTQVADEHRFLVVYPQSWRPRGFWKYPEADNPRSGLRLLRAAIAGAARVACVDRGRVLVTGISSGGRMTYAAGCELAGRILAIAPVSGGTRRLPPCRQARPISVLDLHGTSDPIVSYRGVGPVMAGWARRQGCRAAARTRTVTRYVTRLDWPRCRGGVRVAHLRVQGGGHGWPPLGGPPGITLDGAEAIWRFFAALPSR
ncbi:MAG: PHB depolymerase family esterase [Solirubrobacteraceae bacterium]